MNLAPVRHALIGRLGALCIPMALVSASVAGGVFAQSGSQAAQKLRTSAEIQWLQQEGVVVTSDRAPRRSETIASNVYDGI